MIVIKLWGGIGNQLFQYVFGQYLRKSYKADVVYDVKSYAKVDHSRKLEIEFLDTTVPILEDNVCEFSRYRGVRNRIMLFLYRLNPKNHFISEKRALPRKIKPNHKYFFQGYWQDIKYYDRLVSNDNYALRIKKTPKEIVDYVKLIRESASNSCSVHIRRGDYFLPQNIGTFGVCDANYFERAIRQMKNENANMEFFIFSDDLDWVRKNISLDESMTLIANYDIPQLAYIDLMSKCHHHIISNSSFSWWGAVLNQQPDATVIAPKKWLLNSDKTIALDSWIKI